MSDLSNFVPKSDTITVELELNNEKILNDDDSPMTITVYGPWTKQYRSQGFRLASEHIKKNKEDISFEDLDESNLNLLASVTVDWDITYNGEKPKFSFEKAKEVYGHIYWIPPLLESEINKAGDFPNL